MPPVMSNVFESQRELQKRWVRTALDKLRLTPTELARRIGVVPSTLNRYLNSPQASNFLSKRTIQAIASVADIDTPDFLFRNGRARAAASRTPLQAAPVPPFSSGEKDLPVLGHARAGQGALFMDNGQAQSYIERPWFLVGVSKAYAVYVNDESMEPVYRHGETLYIDPSRPVRRGDDVVVQLGSDEAYIKRLVSITDDLVRCEQYNPAQTINFPRNEVTAIHLVAAALRIRI